MVATALSGSPAIGLAVALLASALALLVGRALAHEIDEIVAALRTRTEGTRGDASLARAERERLDTLLAEFDEAIVFADREGIVRLANPAAERFLAAANLVGRKLLDVVRDHEVLEALAAARSGREAVAQLERESGGRVLRIAAKPLASGELLLTLQDRTSLRRLETQRRDFVANVSHELRTPLATLKAMVETLRGGAVDDRDAAPDFLARIDGEVDRLTHLVNELLTLSRIESGEERLELEPMTAAALVREATERMRPLAERAGLHLVWTAAGAGEVRVDRARLGEVLVNLVHNAIKFTSPGGTIAIEASETVDEVSIRVRDTGVGIDPLDLERIFERFYRSDRARTGGGGTGLGLAIAKHVVQAHGGTIVAASGGRGHGATFTLTLPRAR